MSAINGKNREIAIFVVKLTLVYVAWYVLYHFWLLPNGRLDEVISKNIVAVTSSLLRITGFDVFAFDRVVGIGLANGLEIIDGCNGIETIGLFVGFVIAYPGVDIKRWLFIPTGILVIYLANVVRIYFLAIVQYHWYSGFQVIHDYTFNLIFYLVVFALWAIWAVYGDSKPLLTSETDGVSEANSQAAEDTDTEDTDTQDTDETPDKS